MRPEGRFYAFPNVSGLGMCSLELSLDLIKESDVSTLAGAEVGSAGEGYPRLSVCAKREGVQAGIWRSQQNAHELLSRR